MNTHITFIVALFTVLGSTFGLADSARAQETGQLPPPPFAPPVSGERAVERDAPEQWVDPDSQTLPQDAGLEGMGQEDVPLAEIEAYLQGLTNLQAQFILIGPNYRTSHGTFSLSKPGRIRFDYDPPDEMLVVSDGKTISLVDYELRQVTRWPIKKTPLRPLVRSGEVFGEDVTINRVLYYKKQIRVSIAEAGDEDEGAMELIFSRNPLRLDGWEVIDGRGKRTIIALNDLRTDITLDAKLWTFDDPRPKRRRLPGKR
jgi:outer membrane lipoprotein-sorting protein